MRIYSHRSLLTDKVKDVINLEKEKNSDQKINLGARVVGEIELPSIDISKYIGQKKKILSMMTPIEICGIQTGLKRIKNGICRYTQGSISQEE